MKKYLVHSLILTWFWSICVFGANSALEIPDVCSLHSQNSPGAAVETSRDGLWSDPETWGGRLPESSDNVVVRHSVMLDEGVSSELKVFGKLHLSGNLDVYGSVIVCSGGTLSGEKGQLGFHVEDDTLFAGNTRPGPVAEYPDFHPDDTGLWVTSGATLDLTGPEITPWLNAVSLNGRFRKHDYGISRSVAFRDGKAKLANEPFGWQEGDQLLLVAENGEHSLATLTRIDGADIRYDSALKLTGHVLRIEDRSVYPKIANLSRRLKIVSVDVRENDTNHRAHTVYLSGSYVNIRSVEFRNLGPRGKLGRYPVHWHHAAETQDVLDGSSIWQSVDDGSNRFVTMHMVSGATVSNNVGFRSQGHGFFMEELKEFGNVVAGNLSVDVRYGEELSNIDESISKRTHHFWLRESNEISGNIAAGNNWDGPANKWPAVEGFVLLPSSESDSNPVVTDFECLGCGAVGMWTAVPETEFVNPVSAYATVAAFKSYEPAKIQNPLFLINGTATPWRSQVYLNYGTETLVSGGVLAGAFGIHAHYNAIFSVDGTAAYGDIFIAPTYWDVAANVENARIYSNTPVEGTYPTIKKASPGIIRFSNSCFGSKCNRTNPAVVDVALTRHTFAHLFDTKQDKDSSQAVEIVEPLRDSGFIRIPKELRAGYWSIIPAGSDHEPVIRYLNQRESMWRDMLGQYKGYLHGFPPGVYEVKLYGSRDPESFIASSVATVREGEVVELCAGQQPCQEESNFIAN